LSFWSTRMSFRFVLMVGLLGAMSICARAEDAKPAEPTDLTEVDQANIGEALQPSFVHVQYTLQTDKGEDPVLGAPPAAAAAPADSAAAPPATDWSTLMREERPLETFGLLLDDRHVLAPELSLHKRFIKSIEVRHDDKSVTATPVSTAADQDAVVLQ